MAVDNWEHIVKLLTGWSLPERSEVTGVKGDSGIPWLNVDVKKIGMSLHPRTELRDTGASFHSVEHELQEALSGQGFSRTQGDALDSIHRDASGEGRR